MPETWNTGGSADAVTLSSSERPLLSWHLSARVPASTFQNKMLSRILALIHSNEAFSALHPYTCTNGWGQSGQELAVHNLLALILQPWTGGHNLGTLYILERFHLILLNLSLKQRCFFTRARGNLLVDWKLMDGPPQGPDLNPIQRIWAELDNNLDGWTCLFRGKHWCLSCRRDARMWLLRMKEILMNCCRCCKRGMNQNRNKI